MSVTVMPLPMMVRLLFAAVSVTLLLFRPH
jgi:hypothetical protein